MVNFGEFRHEDHQHWHTETAKVTSISRNEGSQCRDMETSWATVAVHRVVSLCGWADSNLKCNTLGFNERGWNVAGC